MTTCSGEFMFAGSQTSSCAACTQICRTFSASMPIIAAIAPTPVGTASCIYRPRLRTVRTASAKFSVPAATWAEYSPRLCPATHAGFTPCSARTRQVATETVRIDGCVISVCRNSSSGPSKHKRESDIPSAASASSNVCRAIGYLSASSLPMPTACDPCPGKRNAKEVVIETW